MPQGERGEKNMMILEWHWVVMQGCTGQKMPKVIYTTYPYCLAIKELSSLGLLNSIKPTPSESMFTSTVTLSLLEADFLRDIL